MHKLEKKGIPGGSLNHSAMIPSVEVFKSLLENYSEELISTLERNNFLEKRISRIDESKNPYSTKEYLRNIVLIKSSASKFIDSMSNPYFTRDALNSDALFDIIKKHVQHVSEQKSIALINASNKDDYFNIAQPIQMILNKFVEEIAYSLSPNGFITFHAFSIRNEYFFTFHIHGILEINFNIMEEVGIETMFSGKAKNSLSNIYLVFIWLFIKENNGKVNVNRISSHYHLISINIPSNFSTDIFAKN